MNSRILAEHRLYRSVPEFSISDCIHVFYGHVSVSDGHGLRLIVADHCWIPSENRNAWFPYSGVKNECKDWVEAALLNLEYRSLNDPNNALQYAMLSALIRDWKEKYENRS